MPSLAESIAHLRRLAPSGAGTRGAVSNTRIELTGFGDNPGALRGWQHVPSDLAPGSPLVVVLHGCTQTAAGYDHGSGWSALADRFGFAVLFPEQQRGNNPNLCFNWFVPGDIRRDGGEARSIREMVDAMVGRHGIDPARVFVTGLSAGGAMTSVMLATYPELFAGGAIIAGLPYGEAGNVSQALERMRGQGYDLAGLSDRVRAASPHTGAWPTISVWHGTGDATVAHRNAALIVEQWRGLHGVGEPDVVDRVAGHVHRVWHGADGRTVIEEYAIAGMGHGTPITTRGDEACGAAAPYFLDTGISSTYRIAASWGIVPAVAPALEATEATPVVQTKPVAAAKVPKPAPVRPTVLPPIGSGRFDPAKVIDDALRAAGLIKR